MPVAAWIEALAADLLDVEAELRPLIRALHQHHDSNTTGPVQGTTTHARYGRTISISANEARTLLRAAMPLPISSTRLRQPHARMLAALQLFTGHLLTLNDPLAAPDTAAAAGASLLAELRTWIATARWHQACRAAGIRWPQNQPEPRAVSPITRQQTTASEERQGNTLPAMAESHRVTSDPMGAQVARTARRKAAAAAATQDALDLAQQAAAGPPTVVPLRPPAPTKPPIATTTTSRRRSA